MTFFGGNPFATPIGHLIETATDGTLASENWSLNMEICDQINETEEGPKDAVKAIKKRLSMNVGKNYTIVMYTLTVLETCVKNCGRRFHLQIAHKDFLQEIIKIISPKHDPPQIVQEKVLSLIKSWAEAFRGQAELKEVDKMYDELRKKGIEFSNAEVAVPIHTPKSNETQSPQRTLSTRQNVSPIPDNPEAVTPVNITLAPEQLTKLKSELELVRQNCKIFNEMLTELNPNQNNSSDLELLHDLNHTCRQMQQRIVELLDKVANEEVTIDLLELNDDLNNNFLRYEKFERNRSSQKVQQQVPLAAENRNSLSNISTNPQPLLAHTSPIVNLIDFDDTSEQINPLYNSADTSDIQIKMNNINVDATSLDEFDALAHSRQITDIPSNSVAVGSNAAPENTKPASPEDYDAMEQWLEKQTVNPEAQAASATSSEFDQFLAERAKEAESLPNINGHQNTRTGRQLKKNTEENALFSL